MASVAAGNPQAFEDLVRRYQDRAWRLAWRVLGDAAEAQDVVQEAFLKIYRSASGYRPSASFRAYLFQAVMRLCFDIKAKKKPEYRGDTLPEATSGSGGPDRSIAEAERAAAVKRALASLPARQRAVIVLRHNEGLSYGEIAQACGLSEKAVDSLLQRARHSLRRLLRDLS